MPGNVLTDASATYGAITVLATDKSDAVARADGDVATYVIANWGDEVDEALININKWFAGTSSAGISGNTAALLGDLSVAERMKIGGSSFSDAAAWADDLVLGKLTTSGAGLSFLSTTAGTGSVVFADAVGGSQGYIQYQHTTDQMRWGCGGSERMTLSSAGALAIDAGLTATTGSFTGNIDGKILHPINATCYSTVSGSAMYLPMAGVAENASITNYDVLWLAPHDGELVSIEWRASSAGGSTTLGMHINQNTTASCTQNQSVSAGTPITFSTWTGTKTFSKNDQLAFSWNSAASSASIHAAIKVRLDTNT